MKKVINDIDHSSKKFSTPLSSEDGRNYNILWKDSGNPTAAIGSGISEEKWTNIFGEYKPLGPGYHKIDTSHIKNLNGELTEDELLFETSEVEIEVVDVE